MHTVLLLLLLLAGCYSALPNQVTGDVMHTVLFLLLLLLAG
jgi:hypothetical protein